MAQMHDSGVKDWMSDDVSFMDVIRCRLLASRPACGISLLSIHAAMVDLESSALQGLQADCACAAEHREHQHKWHITTVAQHQACL